MAGCVLGKTDADIARAIDTIKRRNAESNQIDRDKAKYRAASGASVR
jgi:hypothetical protein